MEDTELVAPVQSTSILPQVVEPTLDESAPLKPIAWPVLTLKEYTADVSSVEEFFVIPHNAIRRELFDFYDMLVKIHDLQYRLPRASLIDFQNWWRTFYLFLKDYLDFEKQVLYPLLDDMISEDNSGNLDLETARLREKKSVFLDLLPDLNFYITMDSVGSAKLFSSVIPLIEKFSPLLVEYFLDEERSLPPLMTLYMTPEDVRLAKLDLVDFMLSGRDPENSLIILSRWIESEKQLKDWVSVYVPKGKHFAEYKVYMDEFVMTHRNVVRRIKDIKPGDVSQTKIAQSTAQVQPIRTPAFYMAEYGLETLWSRDPMVLPHNAIRRELMDLYYILTSIENRKASVSKEEMTEFRSWWDVFNAFLDLYFEVEEFLLFPYFLASEPEGSDARATVNKFFEERTTIRKLNQAASEAMVVGEMKVSEASLDMILTRMDDFAPVLLYYFRKMETELPRIVERHHKPESKVGLERDIFSMYTKSYEAAFFVPMLIRGIEAPEVADDFRAVYVKGLVRLRMQSWSKKYKDQHWKIVQSFHQRAKGELISPRDESKRGGMFKKGK
mmetsp:Transcript_1011/g.1911  ORF Transcript_1011/g.1911 Transcript_1011/m.1911 type:complete len:556 (-) Transcript_1011:430-2097(-)